MSNSLQQRAEEVLLSMLNKAAEIGSAAVDEIPLVVQELLQWKFAESAVKCLLGLLIASGLIWLYKKVYNYYKNKDLSNHPELLFLMLTAIPWMFVATLVNLTWLKIWVAPRVYLLEYAATLVK